jgi:hypothetical protein
MAAQLTLALPLTPAEIEALRYEAYSQGDLDGYAGRPYGTSCGQGMPESLPSGVFAAYRQGFQIGSADRRDQQVW